MKLLLELIFQWLLLLIVFLFLVLKPLFPLCPLNLGIILEYSERFFRTSLSILKFPNGPILNLFYFRLKLLNPLGKVLFLFRIHLIIALLRLPMLLIQRVIHLLQLPISLIKLLLLRLVSLLKQGVLYLQVLASRLCQLELFLQLVQFGLGLLLELFYGALVGDG